MTTELVLCTHCGANVPLGVGSRGDITCEHCGRSFSPDEPPTRTAELEGVLPVALQESDFAVTADLKREDQSVSDDLQNSLSVSLLDKTAETSKRSFSIKKYAFALVSIISIGLLAHLLAPSIILSKINDELASSGIAVHAEKTKIQYEDNIYVHYSDVTLSFENETIANTPHITMSVPYGSFGTARFNIWHASTLLKGWPSAAISNGVVTVDKEAISVSTDVTYRNNEYHLNAKRTPMDQWHLVLTGNGLRGEFVIIEKNGSAPRFEAHIDSSSLDKLLIGQESTIGQIKKYISTSAGPIKLTLDGDLAGHQAGFLGQIGAPSSGIQVSGTVSDLLSAPNVNGTFGLAAQYVKDISKFFGPAVPADYLRSLTGPIDMAGSIRGPVAALNANVSAVVGRDNDRLILSGAIDNIATTPTININVDARSRELGPLLDLAKIDYHHPLLRKAGPASISADIKGDATAIYSDNFTVTLGDGAVNELRIEGTLRKDRSYEFKVKGNGENISSLLPGAPSGLTGGRFLIGMNGSSDNSSVRIPNIFAFIDAPAIQFLVDGHVNSETVGGHIAGNIKVNDPITAKAIFGEDLLFRTAAANFSLDGVPGVDPIAQIASGEIWSYVATSVAGKARLTLRPEHQTISSVNAAINLTFGEVTISPLEAELLPSGSIFFNGTIITRGSDSSLSGTIKATDVSISQLSSGFVNATADAEISISSTARKEELLRQLTGSGLLYIIGSVNTQNINTLIAKEMARAPDDIIPRLSSSDGWINCVRAPFKINGGVVLIDRWIISTNGVLTNTSGTYDMNSNAYSLVNDIAVGRSWRSLKGTLTASGTVGSPAKIDHNFAAYVAELAIRKKASDAEDDNSRGIFGLAKNLLGSAACGVVDCSPPVVRRGMYECK